MYAAVPGATAIACGAAPARLVPHTSKVPSPSAATTANPSMIEACARGRGAGGPAGAQLAVLVVGDALLEPFWPEGLGVNRGFLSALDASWMLVHFHRTGRTRDTRAALAKRAELLEKLKSLSAFTKDQILRPEYQAFGILPSTRYKLVSD